MIIVKFIKSPKVYYYSKKTILKIIQFKVSKIINNSWNQICTMQQFHEFLKNIFISISRKHNQIYKIMEFTN